MYKMFIDGSENLIQNATKDKCINGTVEKAINAIDIFDFTIYPKNPGYDLMKKMISNVRLYDNDELIFSGRILDIENYMNDNGEHGKSVSCEGDLGFLRDTVQRYHKLSNSAIDSVLKTILNDYNSHSDNSKKIYIGNVTLSVRKYREWEWGYSNTLETIQNLILSNEDFGGEIRLRYENDGRKYLDYTDTEFSEISDTKIQLSKNMISVTKTSGASNVITRLIPLGKYLSDDTTQRLDISKVNNNRIYIDDENLISKYGIVEGTIVFDDCDDANNLKTYGRSWLRNQKEELIQYSAKVADLSFIDDKYDRYKLGNIYNLVNPLIDLDDDVRCISQTITIPDFTQSTLTFGDKFDTLTDMSAKSISATEQQIQTIKSTQPQKIKNIVNHQTDLLRGVEGGNIYEVVDSAGRPVERYYLNAPDINKATCAMRINYKGIGFWNADSGGSALEGPYDYAWTLDGIFNTAYILAQELVGMKINNGNGTFSVDENGKVIAKAIEILGGKISIETNSKEESFITLKFDKWTLKISPSLIEMYDNAIGGHIQLNASFIQCWWNNEQKITLDADFGNITTYAGNATFRLDTNNRKLQMFNSSGEQTISLDAENGTIWSKN